MQLTKTGTSKTKIAKQLGIGEATIYQILKGKKQI
jgi:transposase